MKITKKEKNKWIENQIEFLKPLFGFILITYLAPIILLLSNESHVLSLADFVPSSMVINAIAFYIINALYDFGRRLQIKN
jgi:hypothetical protein